jgi:large conductance mechanosensitive channel
MLKEFRDFIAKGNLVEIAVAFIMGLAFAAVVTAFTAMVLGAIAYVFGSTEGSTISASTRTACS